jgi:ketosteroid isomerase-like protein
MRSDEAERATIGQSETSADNPRQRKLMLTLHSEIRAANDQFMDAVRSGQKELFVSLYTDNAIVLLPGREPLEGSAGVRTFFASFKARGVREIKLTTLEVEAFEDTAWERGSFEQTSSDGASLGKGKYIVIWKRISGGWKLHRDIVNASP